MTRLLVVALLAASSAWAIPTVTIAGTLTFNGQPVPDGTTIAFSIVYSDSDLVVPLNSVSWVGGDFAADLDEAAAPWGSELALRADILDAESDTITLEVPLGSVGAAAVAGSLEGNISWEQLDDIPMNLVALAAGQVGSGLSFDNGQLAVRNLTAGMFEADSIGASALAQDSVTNSELANNAVGTNELVDDAVTEQKLADNSVRSNHIAVGQVNTDDLADNSVDTNKLADNSVRSDDIENGQVTTNDLADSSVDTNKLAAGSVRSNHILNGQVTTDDLANGSVDSNRLAINAVVRGKILDDSVNSAKIENLSIDTTDLADGSVTSAKIADTTIATADLANNAVNTSKLADGAVTSSKIASPLLVFTVLNPACQNFGSLTLATQCTARPCRTAANASGFVSCTNVCATNSNTPATNCNLGAGDVVIPSSAAIGVLVPR
jgi:hypothetical protein